MKKFLLFLFSFFILLIFNNCAFAENFYIKDYKVGITVDASGDTEIKEVIDTYFTKPSHGLIRSIPVSYDLTYPDGTKTRSKAQISNVSVDERYQTYIENGYFNIKMGDPDKLISGDKKYVITYKFKTQNKKKGKEDEFYFNVIGTEWEVPIKHVTFKITMPKEFDAHKAGLSLGKYGTQGFVTGARLYSDGKSVWGDTQKELNPFEGLTVRIPLGKNYYDIKNVNNNPQQIIVLLAIILFTALSYVIWYIYGKDEPVIPIINFYPPKKQNSAETGAQYRGGASVEDITSLIIYLASKGYLRIENPSGNFILEKLKNYDEKNQIESKLMKILFERNDIRRKSELEVSRTFYKDCSDLVKLLNKKTKPKIFDPESLSIQKTAILVISVIATTLLILYAAENYSVSDLISVISNYYILIMEILICLPFIVSGFKEQKNIINKIIFLVFFGGILFIAPVSVLYFKNVDLFFNADPIVTVAGIIGLIISVICLVNLPKRNKYGQMMLNNIEGFKKFIETAKRDEIERLALENQGYCFDILPYAYVLGVASTWIKKLENMLNLDHPSWYVGSMDRYTFKKFTDEMTSVSVPSTENGGISKSSGGYGHSGGGHGGGGGRSW